MKRKGEMNKPHLNQKFNQTIIKIIHPFYGVRLNTMDPMMLIKFMIKISIQDQPKYCTQIKLYLKIK